MNLNGSINCYRLNIPDKNKSGILKTKNNNFTLCQSFPFRVLLFSLKKNSGFPDKIFKNILSTNV